MHNIAAEGEGTQPDKSIVTPINFCLQMSATSMAGWSTKKDKTYG